MQFSWKNLHIISFVLITQTIVNNGSPIKDTSETDEADIKKVSQRKAKAINLYDFLSQGGLNGPIVDPSDYYSYDDTDNEVLSRANGPGYSNNPRRHINSPIYYIRLPPAPYMYVSGLGYVSHPPSVSPLGPTTNSFINLPISFVSNGKPSNVYQWSEGYRPPTIVKPTTTTTTTTTTQKPYLYAPKPDSTIHRLPGQYVFNGKPQDNIVVLRDSYNSLYADALQNFYP